MNFKIRSEKETVKKESKNTKESKKGEEFAKKLTLTADEVNANNSVVIQYTAIKELADENKTLDEVYPEFPFAYFLIRDFNLSILKSKYKITETDLNIDLMKINQSKEILFEDILVIASNFYLAFSGIQDLI